MTAYESSTVQLPHQEFGPCALVQDLLPLYLEGEVSAASSATIVEHLSRCERCTGFMAGAQSVRAQLRRDSAAREKVFARDEPARHALGARQNLVSMIVLLILCSLGAVATLMLGIGIDRFPPMFPGGAILGLAVVGGLVALARRQQPMNLSRWVVLLASCALGALAVVFIVFPRQPGPALIGMLLLLLSVSGLWMSVFQGARRAAEQ